MTGQKRIGFWGILVLVLAAAWLIGSVTDGGDEPAPSRSNAAAARDRPGSPDVYRRINRLTDCSALQREFDIADENADRLLDQGRQATIPISYMSAADDRMRAIGCYG